MLRIGWRRGIIKLKMFSVFHVSEHVNVTKVS